MAATKKAEKAAEQLRISQIGDFKSRMGGVIELPSGLTVKVRNPGGLQVFLKSGTIPNNLMVIIKEALNKGKSPDPKAFLGDGDEIDAEMMEAMTEMLDMVTCKVIVDPIIHPSLTQADVDAWNADPKNENNQAESIEDLRLDTQLYADEIPMDDKQFLLQWVSGGTRDLEKFRQQQQSSLDSVAAITGAGSKS